MNSSVPDSLIDAQAAEWFGRREVGLSDNQEREFQAWLAADARHWKHYAQFDETWALLDGLKEVPIAAVPATKQPARWRWRRVLGGGVVAAAAVAAAFMILREPENASVDPDHYIASTEVGGFRKLELPDGSVIRLNGATEVEVDLRSAERRIALRRGEAFFDVAKDPHRPFIVAAANHSVRAVGTAFNVSLRPETLEVLVTEGKVRVDDSQGKSVLTEGFASAERSLPAAEFPVLEAGYRVVVRLPAAEALSSTPMAPAEVPVAEMEQALAWQAKLLDFDEQPLSEVVAEFNRHNQHQLVIVDSILARQRFGGTFRADNYEVLVELLETRFGVVAERSGQQTTLRLRR